MVQRLDLAKSKASVLTSVSYFHVWNSLIRLLLDWHIIDDYAPCLRGLQQLEIPCFS